VSDIEPIELFVPGRLCLFGEHTDWAAQFGRHRGLCLVIGTDQGLHARVRASDQFILAANLSSRRRAGEPAGQQGIQNRHKRLAWNKDALLEAAGDADDFFRYCAGVASEMISLPGVSGGVEITISSVDLPLRKGVASSAAVCILVARAFDAVYELGLFPHELMELAYRGERLTGSQCGRMDQACIYGKTPVLLIFDGPDQCRVEPVFPRDFIHLFLVDLAGQKDTVRILSDLQAAYPHSDRLQKALGSENERIVRRAHHALEMADAALLGALMKEAQEVFDSQVAPHSPEQLTSPLLHEILSMEALRPHVYGGKGAGSQGDGTAQFVARSQGDRDAAMQVLARRHPEMTPFPLTIPALAQ